MDKGEEKEKSQISQLATKLNLKTNIHQIDTLSELSSESGENQGFSRIVGHEDSLGEILQMSKSSLAFERQQQEYINQLKKDLEMKQNHIEQVQLAAKKRESELEEKILSIQHQHQLELMKIDTGTKMEKGRFGEYIHKTSDTIKKLEQKIEEMEKVKPMNDAEIDALKDDLNLDLEITESKYLSLKKVDRRKLSLKEYVQLLAYERISSHAKELELTKNERDILDQNLKHTMEKLEKTTRELQHTTRMKKEIEDDLSSQINSLTKQNEKLSANTKDLIFNREQYQAKEAVFDDVKKQLDEALSQVKKFQSKAEETSLQLMQAERERDEYNRKLNTVTQQVDLLQQDKMYLSKDNETLSNRVLRLETEQDRLKEKIREIKKKKEEIADKLINVKSASQGDYEKSLQEEIQKIQEKTEKDLLSIKENAKEAYDRENRILRDAKEQAERDQSRLKSELKELNESFEQLKYEHRELTTRSERHISELQSQSKLKTFEAERIGAQLVETTNNLNTARQEIEMLRRKQEVLKTEYYNLKSETDNQMFQIQADLRHARNCLQQYQDMEKALDKGIENIGTDNYSENEREAQLENMKSVPSSHARRLQYCITLTKKINDLDRKIKELNVEISQLNNEKESDAKEIKRLKSKLTNMSQPYSYLVNSIEEKDELISKSQKRISHLEKHNHKVKSEVKKLQKKKKSLENDIEKLLERVQFGSKLRSMLGQLQSGNVENLNPQIASSQLDESGGIEFTK